MNLIFTEPIPQNNDSEIRIIPGEDSAALNGREWVVVTNEQGVISISYK